MTSSSSIIVELVIIVWTIIISVISIKFDLKRIEMKVDALSDSDGEEDE